MPRTNKPVLGDVSLVRCSNSVIATATQVYSGTTYVFCALDCKTMAVSCTAPQSS